MKHPNPDRSLYKGLSPVDRAGKPYAKYFNEKMSPPAAPVVAALSRGPTSQGVFGTFHDAARIFEGPTTNAECGYGFGDDGSAVVAVRTRMPGVTPEMIDWWFGWHGCETARYKLWHPRAHLHAQWDGPEPSDAIGRARYLGRTSFVDEYLGDKCQQAAIQFVHPTEFGLTWSMLASGFDATAVCARIGLIGVPADAGYLVHYVRRAPGGSEMRTRFWLGGQYGRVNVGALSRAATWTASRVVKPTRKECEALLVHCSEEMEHLATFLPSLFGELRATA